MDKIEEIKERVNQKYGAVADGITDTTGQLQATADVSYLLSKLEEVTKEKEEWFVSGMFQTRRADKLSDKIQIAEKALEESNRLVENHVSNYAHDVYNVTLEALKAIRE